MWRSNRNLVLYALLLASLPFARPPILTVGTARAQITDVLLGALYLGLAATWLRRRALPRPDPLLIAGVVFIAALGISLIRASDPDTAGWAKLLLFSGYVLLPWVSTQIVHRTDDVDLAIRGWLIGTLATIAIGVIAIIVFYALDRDFLLRLDCSFGAVPAGPYPRNCLPFYFPNSLANYLALSVPLLIAYDGPLLGTWGRRFAIGGAVVVSLATLSDGIGGIALAAGIVVVGRPLVAGVRVHMRHVAVGIGAVLIAAAFAIATAGHTAPDGYGQLSIGDRDWHFLKSHRVGIWITAAGTFFDHPATGVGYGALVARSPSYEMKEWLISSASEALDDSFGKVPADAHDLWLDIAAQSGVIGVAAFLSLIILIATRLTTEEIPKPGAVRFIPLALTAGFVGAFIFQGLFDAIWEARHLWAFFSVITASAYLRSGSTAVI